MVWVPAGEFAMGSDDFYPEERPVHRRTVSGFWVDEHPVTVAEFRRFVKATGYVTSAEIAPDAKDFPDASTDRLVPGSLVFTPPRNPVPLEDYLRWWAWVPGAQWRRPEGPAARCTGASCTRSRTCRTPTPRRTRRGRASRCRTRRNGSTPPGEVWWARSSRGGTSSTRTDA